MNVVGGVRVDEPGVDLAIALAVASAARGVALNGLAGGVGGVDGRAGGADSRAGGVDGRTAAAGSPCACFGELGLTGELRWVGHPERRLQEAARHGLAGVLAPAGSGEGAREASTLREALVAALPPGRTRPASVAA